MSNNTIAAKQIVHLLGAGSLGCLFAAYLTRAGIALELLVRDAKTQRALHANRGITLTTQNASTTIAVDAATIDCAHAPIERLLVCTKAQQTLSAIDAIKNRLSSEPIIVLLQNGMGVREILQRELPRAIILHALSTEGCFRTARFAITHAGYGETLIGGIDPAQQTAAQEIVQLLQCERPIAFAADIEIRLWLKLAVNSVINPLTALHRCRNGELLQLHDIDLRIAQLCDELAGVAHADGIAIDSLQLREEIYRVARTTAQNKSSMLQDIEAQRVTEIDYINGFIVQRAQAHALPCSAHAHLLAEIHSLHH